MKQILLHRQNPLLPKIYTQVNDEDYSCLKKFVWYYFIYKRTAYAKTFVDGKCISMQMMILNPIDGRTVDHIDGNGLNNQRFNLRPATLQQQRQNKSKHLNSNSQYKGVYYREDRDYFVAQICINGKQTYLGSFQSEDQAALAYNVAARKYYGEFAKLNHLPERRSETHGTPN